MPEKELPQELKDFIAQTTEESINIGFMKGADTVLALVKEADINLFRLIKETLLKIPNYKNGQASDKEMKKHFKKERIVK